MTACPPPGLTPEVNYTQTTQFVFNKERVLPPPRPAPPPPPPPPGALASFLVCVKQVASLPYVALVSLITFDLLVLERWVGQVGGGWVGQVGGGWVGVVVNLKVTFWLLAGCHCFLPSPPTQYGGRRCVCGGGGGGWGTMVCLWHVCVHCSLFLG